jgi:mono/diheme cytochrome c family protein
MPKPLLLVLAGILIAFSPGQNPAQGQGGQQPAPAQAQPTPAAPAPATPASPAPAPALAPTQVVTPAPASYPHNTAKPTAESRAKAKNLYAIDCAMCHADNGNGKTDLATSMELSLNDWTNPKTLAGLEDGQLFLVIRNGKDKMPPETDGRASDDQIWNLVFYIRGFSKGAGSPPSSAQN